MYTKHFQLTSKPFENTPNPDYMFLSADAMRRR